jgi:hypothetical protein
MRLESGKREEIEFRMLAESNESAALDAFCEALWAAQHSPYRMLRDGHPTRGMRREKGRTQARKFSRFVGSLTKPLTRAVGQALAKENSCIPS